MLSYSDFRESSQNSRTGQVSPFHRVPTQLDSAELLGYIVFMLLIQHDECRGVRKKCTTKFVHEFGEHSSGSVLCK